jgi:hypothetical protein
MVPLIRKGPCVTSVLCLEHRISIHSMKEAQISIGKYHFLYK